MTLSDIITAFRNISVGGSDITELPLTTGHEAVYSFFHGIERDFDPVNNVQYPAIFMLPINVGTDINAGRFIKSYSLVLQCIDLLPEDRTTQQIGDALAKTDLILDQILTYFTVNFQGKELTIGGKLVRFDFTFTSAPSKTPLVDAGTSNLTGFECSFTITGQVGYDECFNDEVIN